MGKILRTRPVVQRYEDELPGPGASTSPPVQRGQEDVEVRVPRGAVHGDITHGHPIFFRAERGPDGDYSVVLTEPGLRTFESSLALAYDFGGDTKLSTYSTIADLMERTAVREELSGAMREGGRGVIYRARLAVLRRMLRGSERPSLAENVAGHTAKIVVVGLIFLWAVMQFQIAIDDIAAIPGILAGIPSDILHLHPTSALTDTGNRIADAGTHVLYTVFGLCIVYIVAKLIRPFGRIYRRDQVISGERTVLKAIAFMLRRLWMRYRTPAAEGAP